MRMLATLDEYKSIAFSLNKTIIQCFVFMRGNNTSVWNHSKLNNGVVLFWCYQIWKVLYFWIFKKRKVINFLLNNKTQQTKPYQFFFLKPEAVFVKAKIFSLFGVPYFSLNDIQNNFEIVYINAQSDRIFKIGKSVILHLVFWFTVAKIFLF